MREELLDNVQSVEIPCQPINISSDAGKEKIDVSWQEEFRNNLANINPENYDTLEDFLEIYEPVVEAMHKEYTQTVRGELTRLTEKYDLRFAAAIIYSSFKARLDTHNFACAMECLSKILKRNGIEMDTVVSIAEQLDDVIRLYEENPGSTQKFKISLL